MMEEIKRLREDLRDNNRLYEENIVLKNELKKLVKL